MFGSALQNCNVAEKVRRSLLNLNIPRKSVPRRTHHTDSSNSKILPRLVYMHNPWSSIRAKWQLFKLRAMWDRDFLHDEFIRGTKQSAIVVTDIIREQNRVGIAHFTTPVGLKQITRDMLLSRDDIRLKLINFRIEDIQRAIPMKVNLVESGGRKNCLVDMVFVIMRNTKDFPDFKELQLIQTTLQQFDRQTRAAPEVSNVPHRILFAEIYMRFYRDYAPSVLDNWSVAFYKIFSFDILNYNPKRNN